MTRDETIALFRESEAKRAEALAAASVAGTPRGDASNIAHVAAKDHWNAWANGLLAKRKELEASNLWSVSNLLQPRNNETRVWMEEATVDFSSCLFLAKGTQPPEGEKPFAETVAIDEDSFFSFRSFLFPGKANFTSATFCGGSIPWVVFVGITFPDKALFIDTHFSEDALFDRANFNGTAWFSNANFERRAQFRDATFKNTAFFDGAAFKGGACFQSVFEDSAVFDRAAFDGEADFERATFKGEGCEARFDKTIFKKGAKFERSTFQPEAEFRGATFRGEASFLSANFKGDAFFDDASFQGDA